MVRREVIVRGDGSDERLSGENPDLTTK